MQIAGGENAYDKERFVGEPSRRIFGYWRLRTGLEGTGPHFDDLGANIGEGREA